VMTTDRISRTGSARRVSAHTAAGSALRKKYARSPIVSTSMTIVRARGRMPVSRQTWRSHGTTGTRHLNYAGRNGESSTFYTQSEEYVNCHDARTFSRSGRISQPARIPGVFGRKPAERVCPGDQPSRTLLQDLAPSLWENVSYC
jgi:hypothetical protein